MTAVNLRLQSRYLSLCQRKETTCIPVVSILTFLPLFLRLLYRHDSVVIVSLVLTGYTTCRWCYCHCNK